MVSWPVIIKHNGDAELIYVRGQVEWDNDLDLHSIDYDAADYLVDSSGAIYSLTTKANNIVIPMPRSKSMSLHDVLGLVKAHAAHSGSCCVAKLYAPTIKEAFKIVASLDG